MGYIDDNNHVVIHKVKCPRTQILKSAHGNRVLSAEWDTSDIAEFPVDINIKGIDNKGLLLGVTKIISEMHDINISKLNVECENGLFDCNVQVNVHNTKDVKNLVSAIGKLPDVKEVSRV